MPEQPRSLRQRDLPKMLRRISQEREAELRDIERKETCTMSDFWWIQGWVSPDGRLKQGRWKGDLEVQREAVRFLVTRVLHLKDITKITYEDFLRNRLRTVVKYHHESPYQTLSFAFPELGIQPWEMEHVPNKYWRSMDSVKAAVGRLCVKTEKSPMDLTKADYETNGLKGLLDVFRGSTIAIVMAVYPDMAVDPFTRHRVPRNYWDSEEHRIAAVRELVRRAGKPAEEITATDFKESSMHTLLNFYGNSPRRALQETGLIGGEINPLVQRVPKGYWDSAEHRRHAVQSLADKLHKTLEELDRQDFNGNGLGGLLTLSYDKNPKRAVEELRQFSRS